jgi:PAS domain S-box-containing protein
MLPRRTSIAFTLIIALVGVTTLLLGLAGYFSYRVNYTREWEELRHEHSNLANQLAVALALPAWNFDRDQIDRVLDGAMDNNAVAGVVVRMADRNNTLHARARDQNWGVRVSDGRISGGDLLVETRNISAGNEILGTVGVYVTPRFVSERLGQIRSTMIAVVMIVDAILILSLYLLLWRTVLGPLQQVELFAAAVSSGRRKEEKLRERQLPGELGSLRTSLETMVALLDARYAALQQSGEDLRAGEARLRALGDNLPDGMVYQVVREADGSMRFLYVSAGVERINGLTAADVLRDAALIYDQIVPGDRAKVAAAERDSLAMMTVFDVVVRLHRSDGEARWIRFSSAPRRLPDGRTVWDGIEIDITAQREAADALEQSEQRFRSAMLYSAIGMSVVALDGRWLEANPALCRITGYTREELLTMTFQSITHPEDADDDRRLIRQLVDGVIDTVEKEKRYRHKDGRTVWVQLNASLIRDAQGQPSYLISQIQDITERRLAAAAREEAFGRLALALKAGRLGTFRRNLRTGEGIWDEQMYMICGMPVTAPVPTYDEFVAMIHPSDRAEVDATVRSAARGRHELSYSFRFIRPDGGLRHLETRAIVEPNEDGRAQWLIGVFNDVTNILEAHARLRESAERLQVALKASNLGVWRYNLQTGRTEWDERMFAIFGIDRTEAVPSHEQFFSLIVAEDRAAASQAWDTMLAGGKSYQVQFRIKRRTGEIRNISAQAMISFDGSGRPEWVVGVDGDNTGIVQAIAESTRLREQLVQAQKMETLGTLAAGIAHDFNNLLTGINGFVEMAATSLPANHEAADMLVQARRGAMNARDLVRRILTFSRRSNESRQVPVNLGEVVHDAAPLIAAALPPNISLALDVAAAVPLVLADTGQIQRVLTNLCANGAHAIGSAQGSLRIGIRSQEFLTNDAAVTFPGCHAGHYVCLTVSDTGRGMDEATVARIFEPFFTTKMSGEGTGLGLSIVHDIVTSHQGGIGVRSAVGRGTTFALYFPVAAGGRAQAAPLKLEAPDRHGTGQRVLVVDDEPSVAAVVRLALQRSGYAPEVFTSSEEAWDRFSRASGQFDLLLIDHQMPKLNGADFVQRVRRVTPALPIILMSGRFARSEVPEAQPDTGITSIKKPFEVAELLRQVKTVLQETSAPAG